MIYWIYLKVFLYVIFLSKLSNKHFNNATSETGSCACVTYEPFDNRSQELPLNLTIGPFFVRNLKRFRKAIVYSRVNVERNFGSCLYHTHAYQMSKL